MLVNFDLPGDDDERREAASTGRWPPSRPTERSNPGFRVEEFGDASADKALSKAFEDDFKKAEVTSLPITLIILILAFGALLAAFVPAAPGRDRRGGRDRPHRPDQPDLAGGRVDLARSCS